MLNVEGLRVRPLDAVSLRVGPGEAVAILGANGAGKSTLLRTLAGLVRPTAGRVEFDGRDITGVRAERLVRDGIALVPEGRGIFAELSVRDNLVLGSYLRRGAADLEPVYALFPRLAERARQKAGTLSGGEQQMLAIGRALMAAPRLLMLDEPSLGLAPLAVRQVFDRLAQLRDTSILLVEQNTRAALGVAARGYVLQQGRVVAAGASGELLGSVRSAYLGYQVSPEGADRGGAISRTTGTV